MNDTLRNLCGVKLLSELMMGKMDEKVFTHNKLGEKNRLLHSIIKGKQAKMQHLWMEINYSTMI